MQNRNKSVIKKNNGIASCLVFVVTLLMVSGSAIGVVYSTQESRHLLSELQLLEEKSNALQVEWGQLLLEESSLISQGRIEEIPRAELGMQVPTLENMVVVKR